MSEFDIGRRSLLRALAVAAGGAGLAGEGGAAPGHPDTDPHTQLVYTAVVDAVIPRTPDLAADLGDEYVPGGLEVGLDEYLVTYVNDLFSGLTRLGDRTGDLRLAEPVAEILEEAAAELVATGGNEDPPSARYARDLLDGSPTPGDLVDVAAAGLFPRLSRRDRLNALTRLDEKEGDTAALADRTPLPLVESDGGLVATLVVGFPEVIYYSEWQGYDDVTAPPSERSFENDSDAVQSWRQSGFPGVADGYRAFRGYWGHPDSSLGDGDVWKTVHEADRPGTPPQITMESGEFRENDYDTGDYEEVFPTDGGAASDPLGTVGGVEGSATGTVDDALGDGDGAVEVDDGEDGLEAGDGEGGLLGAAGNRVDDLLDGGETSW